MAAEEIIIAYTYRSCVIYAVVFLSVRLSVYHIRALCLNSWMLFTVIMDCPFVSLRDDDRNNYDGSWVNGGFGLLTIPPHVFARRVCEVN